MAGSIFITKKSSLPVSTRQFDYLAKHLGAAFRPDEGDLRQEVFRPHEEGGMDFLSADGLSVTAFASFSAAADRAYDNARSEKEVFPPYEHLWNALRKLIRADMRSRS